MLLIIPHAGSARNERSLPAQPVAEAAPAIERTLADSRPCPRFHRQRPDDPTPGPQVLHAQARGHEHPQGRHGRTGIIRAAHDKVLRVARTIADLEGSDEIKPQHIAQAVGYRSLDRSVWM